MAGEELVPQTERTTPLGTDIVYVVGDPATTPVDRKVQIGRLGYSQSVTSSTRPAGGLLYEGLGIHETDTEFGYVYDGTAWVPVYNLGQWSNYTPTVNNTGQANVNKTVTYARWYRMGRRVKTTVRLDLTANSAGAGNIRVSLLYTPAQNDIVVGKFSWIDASASSLYASGDALTTGGFVYGIPHASAGAAAFNTQLGTSDVVMIDVDYEASS